MDEELRSSAVPRPLLITAYWPRTQEGGDNIGFGISRAHIFYTLVISRGPRLFNLLVEPRTTVTFPLLLRTLIRMIPVTLTTRMIKRGWITNGEGYFVIDDEGKAISFLGGRMPESIKGRMGVGRKKFLRQINQ
ncbi:hypothetical protein [Dictyobacter aurantiacus]|uniref:Uncharacterized protein n=1 Tax=Dictyobacter aurantiacus TaxID=1936993 RepID=A0A401ZN51_9CHLR|nr:hypothetical protein [Dictyobacter aurantiacus]GCE08186.1 hypothetical protein KDAU_55150 [Dictyobacter aurantiacus]